MENVEKYVIVVLGRIVLDQMLHRTPSIRSSDKNRSLHCVVRFSISMPTTLPQHVGQVRKHGGVNRRQWLRSVFALRCYAQILITVRSAVERAAGPNYVYGL